MSARQPQNNQQNNQQNNILQALQQAQQQNRQPIVANIARIDPYTANMAYKMYNEIDVGINQNVSTIDITNKMLRIAKGMIRSIEQGHAKMSATPFTLKESFKSLVMELLDVAYTDINTFMTQKYLELQEDLTRNDLQKIHELNKTVMEHGLIYINAIHFALLDTQGFLNEKLPTQLISPVDSARLLGHFHLKHKT
ncbi:hypothetical protein [Acidianus two-tailed virus 2]|nr:hypothetical protein [Acidianus two-tailed virus 2]